MNKNRYDNMTDFEIDILKEIGSIGTGNAATALSKLLSKKISVTLPVVDILPFEEAVEKLGGAEKIITAVITRLSGNLEGMVLYFQDMDFIHEALKELLLEDVKSYDQLGEMEVSALKEIGNIVMASYINSISDLTGYSINLSVPGIGVNMLGALLSVPVAEFDYESNKILIVEGNFIFDENKVKCQLLLLLEMNSLDKLLNTLGGS